MSISLCIRTSKCASSSIRTTIRDRSVSVRTIGSEYHTLYRFSREDPDRRLYLILYGQVGPFAGLHPVAFRNAWKFAMVRNPWDRAVSAYSYCRRRGALPASVSFKDYLKIDFAEMEEFVFIHSQPLFDVLAHKGGCEYLDFIGRFERLQDDFDYACAHIGIPPGPLPHRHCGQHADYRTFYDKEGVALVASKYKKDLETFCYSFD